jgi:hypothetical protein
MHIIYRHPDLHETNYSLRPLWHELRAEMRRGRAVLAERDSRRRPVTSRANRDETQRGVRQNKALD